MSVANLVDWMVKQMGCGFSTVGSKSALSLTIPQTLTLIMHKSKNTEKEKFSH